VFHVLEIGESKRNILKYFKLNFDYNSLKGKNFSFLNSLEIIHFFCVFGLKQITVCPTQNLNHKSANGLPIYRFQFVGILKINQTIFFSFNN